MLSDGKENAFNRFVCSRLMGHVLSAELPADYTHDVRLSITHYVSVTVCSCSHAGPVVLLLLCAFPRTPLACVLVSLSPSLGPVFGTNATLQYTGEWSAAHTITIDGQIINARVEIPGSLSIVLPPVSSSRDSIILSGNCSGTVVFQYYGACGH
jgi:hypothetical protein